MASAQDAVIGDCERSIDLTSQLVKISHKITFEAISANPVKAVDFAVMAELAEKVSFIGAHSDKTYLRVNEAKLAGGKVRGWKIDLKKPLNKGDSVKVDVELILGKAVEMLPKEISQRERQLALFKGNHYLYSPYVVKSQTTKVKLPSSSVESYSRSVKPVSMSDSTVVYGPYVNTEAFTVNPMSVHYENNNPFLIVSKLDRVIELSMWGNIAVEETVDIRHNGAVLKGAFSRYVQYSKVSI